MWWLTAAQADNLQTPVLIELQGVTNGNATGNVLELMKQWKDELKVSESPNVEAAEAVDSKTNNNDPSSTSVTAQVELSKAKPTVGGYICLMSAAHVYQYGIVFIECFNFLLYH